MSVEITKHWLTRCLPAPRSLAKEEYPSMITIWSFFLFFWLLPLGVATAGCLPPSPPIPSVTQTHFMSSFTTSMDIFFGLLFFLLPRSFIFNNLCQYIHYPYTYLYQTISALPLTFSPNISSCSSDFDFLFPCHLQFCFMAFCYYHHLQTSSHHRRCQYNHVNLHFHSCCYPLVTDYPWYSFPPTPPCLQCFSSHLLATVCCLGWFDPIYLQYLYSLQLHGYTFLALFHTNSVLHLLTFIPLLSRTCTQLQAL